MRGKFHDDMSMDEIMRMWPETIRTILDQGLLCVGCPIAPFHTPDDAIREHGIDADTFRLALQQSISASGTGKD